MYIRNRQHCEHRLSTNPGFQIINFNSQQVSISSVYECTCVNGNNIGIHENYNKLCAQNELHVSSKHD